MTPAITMRNAYRYQAVDVLLAELGSFEKRGLLTFDDGSAFEQSHGRRRHETLGPAARTLKIGELR